MELKTMIDTGNISALLKDRGSTLKATIDNTAATENVVREYHGRFTNLFYDSLEATLKYLTESGVNSFRIVKRETVNTTSIFKFMWGDRDITYVSSPTIAFPSSDNAGLPHEMAGRILLFWGDQAVGEIYTYPNGHWYGKGVIGNIHEKSMEKVVYLHQYLIENLVNHTISSHRELAELDLTLLTEGKSPTIGFRTEKISTLESSEMQSLP